MKNLLPLVLLALAAGFCIPVQAGINAQLNLWTRSPVLAAAISFAVGTLALFGYALAARIPYPALSHFSTAPWWVWLGGLLGAYFVFSTVILAPRIGATSMLALILAGQMLASLVLDHFGWLGYPVQPVSLQRLLGALLIGAGVYLVRFF
ncbi:MAG TPA: DMT family transporter [Geothermobacteraceae bacterium]|nr:DMT family transporter [Geothermobacteraceae bacterium]